MSRGRAARWALGIAIVLAGVGLLAASAWLSVPFYPVPMTMQTLAVLLVGGLLGPRMGAATVATYLMAGLAGAPVFHNGTFGPAILFGPTGGYLVGFVPAAALMGWFAQRSRQTTGIREFAFLGVGAVLAEVVIYAVGVPWLSVYVGSIGKALQVGMAPFVLGDLLKMAVAIGALRLGTGVRRRKNMLPREGAR
ncbi:MAG: biotin transporter BioY [Thermoleophilia bacterium]|nr:biotin transporter BioY [Thermoleophilia bacterium]